MAKCDDCGETVLKTTEGLHCVNCGRKWPYPTPEEVEQANSEMAEEKPDDTIHLPGKDEMQPFPLVTDRRTEILTCPECGKKVKGGGGMAAHMKKHKPKPIQEAVVQQANWVCKLCEHAFPTQQSLAGHMAMHKAQEVLPQLERVEKLVKDKILDETDESEKDKLRRVRKLLLEGIDEYL